MNSNINEIVAEEIKSQLNTEDLDTSENQLLKEDLGFSSFKLIMLLTNITDQLEISLMDFNDYELLRLKTVGDLVQLLISKQQELNDSYDN